MQEWQSVIRGLLSLGEELSFIFHSFEDMEIWKGTEHRCPSFTPYYNQKVIITHIHPNSPDRTLSPPSPNDLVCCISSINPHIVFAKEGCWLYKPTSELQTEWKTISSIQQETLADTIVHNAQAAIGTLLTGIFFEPFTDNISCHQVDLDVFISFMKVLIPRKDKKLPTLGFDLQLIPWTKDIDISNMIFDPTPPDSNTIWNINKLNFLLESIKETKDGACVLNTKE